MKTYNIFACPNPSAEDAPTWQERDIQFDQTCENETPMLTTGVCADCGSELSQIEVADLDDYLEIFELMA